MIKWVAYFDYTGKFQCGEVEVIETKQLWKVPRTFAYAQHFDFKVNLFKGDSRLFDSRDAAINALRRRIAEELAKKDREIQVLKSQMDILNA